MNGKQVSAIQTVIGATADFCLLFILIGLFVRKRHAQCVAFTLYVPAVLVADLLILFWPDRFYGWTFWLLKETVHSVLKFGIALELAMRTFQVFPGASATARRVLLLVIAATGGAVLAVSPGSLGSLHYGRLVGDLHARILNGTMWLFTAITVVILWYRLPVSSFHKAILLGFVPYLLVFTLAMNLLRHYWKAENELPAYLHSFAYVLLLVYWTRAVWSRDVETPTGPTGTGLDGSVIPKSRDVGSERGAP